MKSALILAAALGIAAAAWAQSDPSLYQGQIPSATQWNSYFAAKVNTTDGTFASPVILKDYTVATLPTCSSTVNTYALAVVTDASSPTYNATLTGSSTTIIPVFCNGTTWRAH